MTTTQTYYGKRMKIVTSLDEQKIDFIKKCLKATVEGDFFEEWEFQTLMGVDRKELKKIYLAWPKLVFSKKDTMNAIHASMANLIGYPHGMDSELLKYIPEGKDEIYAFALSLRSSDL